MVKNRLIKMLRFWLKTYFLQYRHFFISSFAALSIRSKINIIINLDHAWTSIFKTQPLSIFIIYNGSSSARISAFFWFFHCCSHVKDSTGQQRFRWSHESSRCEINLNQKWQQFLAKWPHPKKSARTCTTSCSQNQTIVALYKVHERTFRLKRRESCT